MPVRGVFFDLYGTLFLSEDAERDWTAWRAGFLAALGKHGLRLEEEAREQLTEAFLSRAEPAVVPEGRTVYEERVRTFLVDAGLDPGPHAVREVARSSAEAWHAGFEPDREAAPLLDELRRRRYRLALVSNFDHPPLLRARLAESGLASFFDHVVVSAEVGVKKPDPAIFQPSLEALGLAPHEVLYVGDSEGDVTGARAAGIRPVRIHHGGAPPSGNGVPVITRLGQLRRVLLV